MSANAKKKSNQFTNQPVPKSVKPVVSTALAPAKKVAKKMKVIKLEERIAPGMVGSGLVDPGMTDAGMDAPQTQDAQTQGNTSETSLDNTHSGQTSDGQYSSQTSPSAYLDDASPDSLDADASDVDAQDYNEMEQTDADAEVQSSAGWQEADWIEAQADGSFQAELPEGVSVDAGIANFTIDAANEALPLPDSVTIQSDGSLNVELPQGAQYFEQANALILPADSVEMSEIPQEMNAFQNPDGSVTVPLPEQGMTYNADTNSLNINNDTANDLLPNNVELASDGTVQVELPPGAEMVDEGVLHIPAESASYMDNPPPAYFQEADWASPHADGSVTIDPPEGVEVDGGIATVPFELVNDELPLPEEMTINADGTCSVQVPEDTVYNSADNSLTFPANTVNIDELPAGIQASLTGDGSVYIQMPQGITFDADTQTVNMNNYWTNEVISDSVHVNDDGSVVCALPLETTYNNDGSFTLPPEHVNFAETPSPDFIHDVSYTSSLGDGSYHVNPPESFTIEAGTVNIPHDAIAEYVPHGDEMTFNADGSADVEVPKGSTYDANANSLTFPEGKVQLSEIPDGISAHINPDGTMTVLLPPGIEYSPDTASVHMNSYWANEMLPESVELTSEGSLNVTLPPNVEMHDDGSFTIPSPSADFINEPYPSYVAQGPEWVSPNPDGSFTCEAPQGFSVDATAGTLTCPVDMMAEQFSASIPEEFTINANGTSSIEVPEGTQYNADANRLIFPEGTVQTAEIPEGIVTMQGPDGSLAVDLPAGVTFDSANGEIKLDQYWTNEILPAEVTIQDNGYVQIQLPEESIFHGEDSFTVPASAADFLDAPDASYLAQGPDWVSSNADGSYTCQVPTDVTVNVEEGTLELNTAALEQHFENSIPEEVSFNNDGTMDVKLPDNLKYDAANGTITFPYQTMSVAEIPEGIDYNINPQGVVTVTLPEGISYSPEANSIHLNNDWTNAVTPPGMDCGSDGIVRIDLPPTTAYHQDGSFTVPEHSTDFVYSPAPMYVSAGPDWVTPHPDGAVTFTPPQGYNVYPESGHAEFSTDQMNEHFEGSSDHDVTYNADGTADVKLPPGTQYDAATNSINFPEGSARMDEIPDGLVATYNADGGINVVLPPGINFDGASNSVHVSNEWVNEIAPSNVEFKPDGQVMVQMPSDTQYHPGGECTVQGHHGDFMDQPEPPYCHDGPEWVEQNPDGSVHISPPADITVDPQAGSISMSIEFAEANFPIPEEININPDGTMDIKVPPGTTFSDGTISFAPGTVSLNDLPDGLTGTLDANGFLRVELPAGMEFQGDHVHMSNDWANAMAPGPIQIGTDGTFTVDLPDDTQFWPDGSFTLSDDAKDFLDGNHENHEGPGAPGANVYTQMPNGQEAIYNTGTGTYRPAN